MHENLVKRLRTEASAADFFGRMMPAADNNITKLCTEAADAIEELTAIAESCKRSMEAWADEAARAHEMIPRWIPVTERLPEEFQPVWVACKMEGRENWTFDTIYDPYLKCPWGQYYYLEKGEAVVYAWMDRSDPEPPKEE